MVIKRFHFVLNGVLYVGASHFLILYIECVWILSVDVLNLPPYFIYNIWVLTIDSYVCDKMLLPCRKVTYYYSITYGCN